MEEKKNSFTEMLLKLGEEAREYNKLKIEIVKLNKDAKVPFYSKDGDVGMDLTATSRIMSSDDDTQADYIEYGTGIAIKIPEGYYGMIYPRSSNSKKDLTLCNSVGIIDSNYTGELKLRYKIDGTYNEFIDFEENEAFVKDANGESYAQSIYNIGDKIGQLIILPYPTIKFVEVTELQQTNRNSNGFGSTGN